MKFKHLNVSSGSFEIRTFPEENLMEVRVKASVWPSGLLDFARHLKGDDEVRVDDHLVFSAWGWDGDEETVEYHTTCSIDPGFNLTDALEAFSKLDAVLDECAPLYEAVRSAVRGLTRYQDQEIEKLDQKIEEIWERIEDYDKEEV